MTTTVEGYISKTIKAELNNEKVVLAITSFVCNLNDYLRGESWIGDKNKAEGLVNRRISNYERLREDREYFINSWAEKAIEHYGETVYKLPEDFTGMHYSTDLDDYEVVGTLLKVGKKWVVETDLEKVEQIRREKEFDKMKKGNYHIYFDPEDNTSSNDIEKYKDYLKTKDLENGRMCTRGHGLGNV